MAHKVAIINGKQPSGGVGGVTDADLSNVNVNFMTAGVLGSNDYKVEAQATPDMTVKVNTGKAHVVNSGGTMSYVTELDAAVNATIGDNSSGNDRIDAVVIKIDLGVTPNQYADNVASIVVVQGTPAPSPSPPSDSDIQTVVGSGNPFYRLANVTVVNGAISITNADISDQRAPVEFKLITGRFRFNLSTNKLQFSHDGTNYKDVGAGVVVPTFTKPGTLAVQTNVAPVLIAPFDLVIKKAFARVKTAPVGADIIVDINKNGTSIWATNPTNRLKILDGQYSGSQTNFDTTSLVEGDYLTLDIDQVGSTTAGADITVEVYCEAA